MKILVTGGCGFIGSNFIRYILGKYPAYKIVNLDLLTYAGNRNNLIEVEGDSRYRFIQGDIGDLEGNQTVLRKEKIDVIVNFAAESHNGRAVLEPSIFVRTNVLGTQILLEAARKIGIGRFHHVSTCEVFGDLALDDEKSFREEDAYRPRTPYNASKAGADHEVMAYYHTFKLPVTVNRSANNYGPFQFPEKVIPRFIINAMENKKVPLFKSSENRREWLYTEDHCAAIDAIIHQGKVGETYNIGSGVEKSIEEIADAVLLRLDKPASLKMYIEDRPGHDRRYLLNSAKIQCTLGWKPKVDFESGMDATVEWYKGNESWWRPLLGRGFEENYTVVKSTY
jgi:dTDP-glucose 4,6-dehydratase